MTRRALFALGLGLLTPAKAKDLRLKALRWFLEGRPVARHAGVFLDVAQQYDLDWRLLPALSIVETGGGRRVRNRNNIFGWNSGRSRFPSVPAAIEQVGAFLGEGRSYRDLTTYEKLCRYNPRRKLYARRVEVFMKKLDRLYDELCWENDDDDR